MFSSFQGSYSTVCSQDPGGSSAGDRRCRRWCLGVSISIAHSLGVFQPLGKRDGHLELSCLIWYLQATYGYLHLSELKLNRTQNSGPQSHQMHLKCAQATCSQWLLYEHSFGTLPSWREVLLDRAILGMAMFHGR